MARVEKKIKKTKKKHSKKFWTLLISISSSVAVLLIVGLVLLLVFKPWDNDEEYDYFSNINDSSVFITYADYTDEKQNYDDYEHIFIFYYSSESFLPDENLTHKDMEDGVYNLYKAVSNYNNSNPGETVRFYIINTNSKKSSKATSDEKSGIEETDQLAYYYNGTYSTYGYNNETDYPDKLSGSNTFKDAVIFVNGLAKD